MIETKNHNKQKLSDQEILKNISDRICWDIRVSNSDILVKVNDGCVMLLGYFDRAYRHKAAISLIKSTDGVTGLVDQSQVLDSYFRTDRDLEALIVRQVAELPLLSEEWIEVDVCDAKVTLTGQVTRPRLKAAAARAAWELSGIKDCDNCIQVCEAPSMPRAEVQRPDMDSSFRLRNVAAA